MLWLYLEVVFVILRKYITLRLLRQCLYEVAERNTLNEGSMFDLEAV